MGIISRIKSVFKKDEPKSTPAPNPNLPKFSSVKELQESSFKITPTTSSGGGSSSSSSSSSSGRSSGGGGGGGRSYQGPVQPGVDEQTFRETGESIKVQSVEPSRTTIDKTEGGRFSNLVKFDVRGFGKGDSSVQTGGPMAITESEQNKIGMRGAFITPTGYTPFEYLEAGKTLGGYPTTPTTFVSSTFGPTKEELFFEKVTAKTAQGQIGFLVDTQRTFRSSPELFIGMEGVDVKEVEGGKEITLTENYFTPQLTNIREQAVVDTRKELASGFKSDRDALFKANIASSLTAGGRLGVGVAEFGGSIFANLGQQQIGSGTKVFEFTGDLDFKKTPLFYPTEKKFLESPVGYVKDITGPQAVLTGGTLLVGGVYGLKNYISGVKELGFVKGSVEAGQMFNPLSIKSGIYTPKISPTDELQGISFKSKQGNIVSRDLVFGRTEGDILGVSKQRIIKLDSGKSFSVMDTKITSPALKISGGGAYSEFGLRTTRFTGFGLGEGGEASMVKNIKNTFGDYTISKGKAEGFIGDSFTQPRSDTFVFKDTTIRNVFEPSKTFKKVKGGGFETPVGEDSPFSLFAGGRRTAKFKGFVDRDLKVIGQKPSNKFKVDLKMKGVEVDLNKLYGVKGTGGKDINVISKGPSKSVLKTTKQELISSVQQNVLDIPKPSKQPSFISKVKPALVVRGTQQSQITSGLDFQSLQTKLKPQESEIFKFDNQFKQIQAPLMLDMNKGRVTSNVGLSFDTSFKPQPKLRENQFSGIKTSSQQKQIQKSIVGGSKFGTDFFTQIPPPPTTPGGFFIPPFFPLLGQVERKGRVKGKRKLGRTPSFAAAQLGITGKSLGKLEETGLIERPLPIKFKKLNI